jgi:RNA polymerase sporulation-specific sigma factor
VNYENFSDELVIRRAQRGDVAASETMLKRYDNLVRSRAKAYFIPGGDLEDLLQTAKLGLWKAVVDFKPERGVGFGTYAKIVITRNLIDSVKTATRQKYTLLNESVSFSTPVGMGEGEEGTSLEDTLMDKNADTPEVSAIKREDVVKIDKAVKNRLSNFEWDVLIRYQTGKSYREIGMELRCNRKCVDNALVRLKKKVPTVVDR